MNQLILLGNIGADAEVHKFENNRFAIRFNLAVTESWKDNQGVKQSKTDWFRCIRYTTSEALAPYLKKGMKVMVVGKASSEAYIKENEAVSVNLCIVKEIEFVDSAPQSNSNQSQGNNQTPPDQAHVNEINDDLPF